MSRREIAEKAFTDGYNCSQSIVIAFADLLPADTDTVLKLVSPYGGGMGRLREVCGAFTGALAVLGLLRGYSMPETGDKKARLYERVQALAASFKAEHRSVVCRDMLRLPPGPDTPKPEPRTEEYYRKRPCLKVIGDMAELLENELERDDQPRNQADQ